MGEAEGFETVTVAIPLHGCLGCPGCRGRMVNLAGELQPCTREDCPMGTVVRALTIDEKAKLAEILLALQRHVEDCATCQESTNNRTMCSVGAELHGQWLAWMGPQGPGPHFRGGRARDVNRMIEATAALRDEGGLPSEASLIFSQLLLNLAGHAGRSKADELIAAFLDAADVPTRS